MSKVTAKRKDDHININLERDVDFPERSTGLERFRLQHRALPELNLAEVSIQTSCFGKIVRSPLFISSMTGGTERARRINRHLAAAAQTCGLAMGVGSQRAAIEDPSLEATFALRDIAPDIPLFANLGAIQLNYGYGIEECQRAVDMLEADALILHFNALQEAVQPEGDTNFAGLAKKVEAICTKIDVPVIAKEVGWGFSPADLTLLADAGISAVDVAGAGGTSWSQVESHRAPDDFHAQIARSFANWGISTADALCNAHLAVPRLAVFASGGLRDGIDVAKCIALGASLVGMAGPFLKAADTSIEDVIALIEVINAQLRIAMFAAGVGNIEKLASLELIETTS